MSNEPNTPGVPPDKNARLQLPGFHTPEQGCIGCAVFVAMIVVSVSFWLFVWWRNEPNLHNPTPTPSASAITPALPSATPVPTQPPLRYNRRIPQSAQPTP